MRTENTSGSSWKKALVSFVLVLIASGALYSGYFFFCTVRALVASVPLPFAENVAQARTMPPGRSSEQELPDLTNAKERANILLLGIDQRGDEAGPWRTDTMILVSVDPATNSAAILSIPRDLYVTIPGYGQGRINTAHITGDVRGYPGGGVALAKKTVSEALGIPVHYYVRVNFTGFEKLVDAIGGLTINVEKTIHDERYPDNNYGYMTVHIPAGLHEHMDGATALQYARSRHGNSDFDRMARQQAVMLAARDKLLSLDFSLASIPKLIKLAGDSVQTDLTLEEILALAEIGKRIDRANIRQGAIDATMTTTTVLPPNGAMVEMPQWDKIHALVADLFPSPAPEASPRPNIVGAQLANEAARIELQNGTLVGSLAQDAAADLRGKGFNVVLYDNASRFDYPATALVVYADKPYTVETLTAELGVSPENVRREAGSHSDIDILVILGRDYAQRSGR